MQAPNEVDDSPRILKLGGVGNCISQSYRPHSSRKSGCQVGARPRAPVPHALAPYRDPLASFSWSRSQTPPNLLVDEVGSGLLPTFPPTLPIFLTTFDPACLFVCQERNNRTDLIRQRNTVLRVQARDPPQHPRGLARPKQGCVDRAGRDGVDGDPTGREGGVVREGADEVLDGAFGEREEEAEREDGGGVCEGGGDEYDAAVCAKLLVRSTVIVEGGGCCEEWDSERRAHLNS